MVRSDAGSDILVHEVWKGPQHFDLLVVGIGSEHVRNTYIPSPSNLVAECSITSNTFSAQRGRLMFVLVTLVRAKDEGFGSGGPTWEMSK